MFTENFISILTYLYLIDMIELRLIRQNPQVVKDGLKRRQQDISIVDNIINADIRWRELLSDVDRLRQERNHASREVKVSKGGPDAEKLIEKVRGFKNRLFELEKETAEIKGELDNLLLQLPNSLGHRRGIGYPRF